MRSRVPEEIAILNKRWTIQPILVLQLLYTRRVAVLTEHDVDRASRREIAQEKRDEGDREHRGYGEQQAVADIVEHTKMIPRAGELQPITFSQRDFHREDAKARRKTVRQRLRDLTAACRILFFAS